MSKTKVLIFGRRGQIGEALLCALKPLNFEVIALGREEVDLCEEGVLRATLSCIKPDVVINAAAFTDVEAAEDEENGKTLHAVNVKAPFLMAKWCDEHGALFIHFSTDYVFDGKKRSPYTEGDVPSPINHYGVSKQGGVDAVLKSAPSAIILSLSWVHAPRHANFVTKCMDWLLTHPVVRVVDDQVSIPTSANEVARAVVAVLEKTQKLPRDYGGLYHMAAAGFGSRLACAEVICETLQSEGKTCGCIKPARSSEFATKARRPAYSVLDTGRFNRTFDFEPHSWEEGVKETVRESLK